MMGEEKSFDFFPYRHFVESEVRLATAMRHCLFSNYHQLIEGTFILCGVYNVGIESVFLFAISFKWIYPDCYFKEEMPG